MRKSAWRVCRDFFNDKYKRSHMSGHKSKMAAPTDLGNAADFDKFLDDSGTQLVVVHFWAAWAPQCQQMNDVMTELAKDTKIKAKYAKVEAEAVPEISMRYSIEAVPTCILLRHKKTVDRVNGANAPELTSKVQEHAKTSGGGPPPAAKAPAPKEDLNTRLKKLINSAPVILFMKGVPEEPRCGFSRTIIGLLNEQGVKYSTFNILADEEVRAGLKTFSNWPTFPQLYVSGELLGGLDIVKEMIESDEFKDAMPKQESLDDRLKALINKDKVVVFMKGNPEQPRCGFSKTIVGMFNETKIPYGHFDILSDEEVRQGLKTFSNWPTYPQVYVNGELVGGLDIIKELQESDELISTLKGE